MALAYGISSALQVDLGFTEGQISTSTTVTLLAGALGCALAGVIGDRIGPKRLLALAIAGTSVATFYLGWVISEAGLGGVSFDLYLACSFLYRFALGICMGVRSALCMAMTNPAVGASQFTGYNSLGNLAIGYSGYWQGLAVSEWGYGATLGIDGLAGLVAILLIPWLLPSTGRATAIARVAESVEADAAAVG